MRIVIDNLPKEVSEEEICKALNPFAHVGKVTLIMDGSSPAAIIEVDMKWREQAYALAERISGHYYKGRRLGAWVPLWTE